MIFLIILVIITGCSSATETTTTTLESIQKTTITTITSTTTSTLAEGLKDGDVESNLIEQAAVTGNQDVCQDLTGAKKDSCLYETIKKDLNSESQCDILETEDVKNKCTDTYNFNQARALGDINLCEKIKATSMANRCRSLLE